MAWRTLEELKQDHLRQVPQHFLQAKSLKIKAFSLRNRFVATLQQCIHVYYWRMNTPTQTADQELQPTTVMTLLRPQDQLRYFQHDPWGVRLTVVLISWLPWILAGLARIIAGIVVAGFFILKLLPMLP